MPVIVLRRRAPATVFRAPRCRRPRRRAACAALVLSLAAAGCEWYGSDYPTGTAEPALVVHGLLAGGAAEQEIVVEYARPVDEGVYRGLTPARGARVAVSGGGEHAFREDPAQPGVYRASFTPAAGERYLLRVDGPAGETVRGETRVPAAPRLATPRADTTISLGQWVTVSWNQVPGAAAYVVVDRAPGQSTSALALANPAILSDTSITSQWGALGRTVFPVRVAAVDDNYLRYTLGASAASSQRIRLQRTVEGGFGLFGSYAISAPRVITVR